MSGEIKDITAEMISYKSKHKHPIKDDKLKNAFPFAVMEARKWYNAGMVLEKEHNLSTQSTVCYILSTELSMKGLLMNSGINVTTCNCYGHDISKLFKDLDADIKDTIKNTVQWNQSPIYSLLDEKVVFTSFEKELEFIANDFMSLRYEYETFLNGKGVYQLGTFIRDLALQTLKIANQKLAETINAELY